MQEYILIYIFNDTYVVFLTFEHLHNASEQCHCLMADHQTIVKQH